MAKQVLTDNHGRTVDYVRLAVTDRCNLRCFYCMPESGIDYLPKDSLLAYEEMVQLVKILQRLGIRKVRITGGEPFLRKDLMDFLRMLTSLGVEEVHITTNGTLTLPHIPEMKKLGIRSINLSLDTLNTERFQLITRRKGLETVLETLYTLLDHEIDTKVNMVVMRGKNDQDIIPMAKLAQDHPLTVRFIEEMPFNGTEETRPIYNHLQIESILKAEFPSLQRIPVPKTSTSTRYQVDDFAGHLGIIAAFSRTFCGTCNRLRVTPQGVLRTCLYGEGVFNVRDMMREGATDQQMASLIVEAVGHRAKDGFEAEHLRKDHTISESMSTIGG